MKFYLICSFLAGLAYVLKMRKQPIPVDFDLTFFIGVTLASLVWPYMAVQWTVVWYVESKNT